MGWDGELNNNKNVCDNEFQQLFLLGNFGFKNFVVVVMFQVCRYFAKSKNLPKLVIKLTGG